MSVERDQQQRLRELDRRSSGGVEVTLLWSERTGAVFVAVEDRRIGKGFQVAVDPADALHAFRHPYAYRGRRPIARAQGSRAATASSPPS